MLKPQKSGPSLLKIVVIIAIFIGAAVAFVNTYPYLASVAQNSSAASAAQNLARAQEVYQQGGSSDEIRKMLEPLTDGKSDPSVTPQALLLLAQIDKNEGNLLERRELLKRAYQEFPASQEHPRIAIAYAGALSDAGDKTEATRILEEVRQVAPPELRAPALTELGRIAEQKGDLLAARDLLRKAVADALWDSPEWNAALDALGKVNVAIIFSPDPTPESEVYRVQKGDSITRIGNTLNTTQGLLTRANNVTETTVLTVNQPLKYTPKDFKIIIERSKCRVFLIDKDGIFKRYPAGLGKPGHETTLGSYKIGNKEKNPIWHKPGFGPIPANDPANELGTRWMPLMPDQKSLPTDLGIHGTIRPDTVGTFCSNGCARLYPADVEELYDLIVRSTPVEIVETWTQEMANKEEDNASSTP